VFLLLLTGPPGAGKSEASMTLHDQLGDAGVATALLQIDELGRSYPPIGRERLIGHLASLSASYREAGYEVLLVTATLEDDDYTEATLRAAGADDHLLVRLEAEPATLKRRLLAREPARWSGLPALVEISRYLAETMKRLSGVDLVISTEDRKPEEVAAELEVAVRERTGSGEISATRRRPTG
jgi:hypothetical protein